MICGAFFIEQYVTKNIRRKKIGYVKSTIPTQKKVVMLDDKEK